MMEIVIWSLMVGSLGVQAAIASGWLHRHHFVMDQQREEEEIILTRYESMDETAVDPVQPNGNPKPALAESHLIGWEFKIVRAQNDLFRNPAIFHKLCQEEAQVGWILLEKLDDCRVRFKRPIAMRDMERSELPRFDPYRCQYGPSSNWVTWLGAIALLIALILPAFLGYALVSTTLIKSRSGWSDMPLQSPPSPALPENQSTP